jgi:hypothetical protein
LGDGGRRQPAGGGVRRAQPLCRRSRNRPAWTRDAERHPRPDARVSDGYRGPDGDARPALAGRKARHGGGGDRRIHPHRELRRSGSMSTVRTAPPRSFPNATGTGSGESTAPALWPGIRTRPCCCRSRPGWCC